MTQRSTTIEALIVKRTNTGEADRVVTLLTQEFGKITTIAKGSRKMHSSKRAMLEPGNLIKAHLIQTKSLPLMTQAVLLSDCRAIHQDLPKIRQLVQVLEILDKIFVEEELEPDMFELILTTRDLINQPQKTTSTVLQRLSDILEFLGYARLEQTNHTSILEYVSELTERPMKSWEYLKVNET